jgi:hypothetical protein
MLLALSNCASVSIVPGSQGAVFVRAPNALAADMPVMTDAAREALALLAAQPRTLRQSVTLVLVSSTEELHPGLSNGWTKAWAQFDSVKVLTPRRWNPSKPALVTLLVHELFHCLVFQSLGTSATWNRRPLPFWFREGSPSVFSGQAPQLPSLEDSAQWYARHSFESSLVSGQQVRFSSPNEEPKALEDEGTRESYALALHAFSFFVKRFGATAELRIEQLMADGAGFDEAFQTATGLTHAAFRKDVASFLELRAFRSQTKPAPAQ